MNSPAGNNNYTSSVLSKDLEADFYPMFANQFSGFHADRDLRVYEQAYGNGPLTFNFDDFFTI